MKISEKINSKINEAIAGEYEVVSPGKMPDSMPDLKKGAVLKIGALGDVSIKGGATGRGSGYKHVGDLFPPTATRKFNSVSKIEKEFGIRKL